MSKVVIVGDIYYADLYPDQGLPGGGQGGHPSHPIWGQGGQPDQGLPGGGYPPYPSRPIHHPGHPDHGLPSQPGQPSQPIYHPGHPDHGHIPHPDQGLPGGGGSSGSGGQPSHPIHLPGVPDQGLPEPEPVPPEGITDPELPEGYDDELVIAVKKAGGDDWDYYAYSVQPDQGQPAPTPQSGGRRSR